MKKFKKVLAIIICVVLFFLISADILLISVKSMASIGFVNNVLDDIDVSSTVEDLRESDGAVGEVIDELYERAEVHGFSEEQVDKVVGSDVTKEIIERYADSMINDSKSISEEDVKNIIENNVDEIIDNSNGLLKKEDKSELLRAADTWSEAIADNLPNKEDLKKAMNIDEDKDERISLTMPITVMIIITVILLGLVIYLAWDKFKWVLYTGVTIMVSTIPMFLLVFLSKMLSSVELDGYAIKNISGPLFSKISGVMLTSSLMCLVLAIIEIVVYIVLKKNMKKEAK